MIRSIRVLGAALGGLVGIVIVTSDASRFNDVPGAGAIIVAWLIAWSVLGFSVLPYLTIVPALRVVRGVQALSTAEFVTAVIGLLLGLLMGLLLGLAAVGLSAPVGNVDAARRLPFPRPGHGRPDGRKAAGPPRGRRGDRAGPQRGPADGRPARRPAHRCRQQRDHRRPDRRDRRIGLPVRHAHGAALRPRRDPAHRGQPGRPAPEPGTPRPRDPGADAEGRSDPGHRHRGRRAGVERGRRETRRRCEAVQPRRPDE